MQDSSSMDNNARKGSLSTTYDSTIGGNTAVGLRNQGSRNFP